MCYSPEVSFSSSAVLASIGAVTIKKYHRKQQIMFALFPLLCAIQQAAEGVLWLQIAAQNIWVSVSKYIFLSFALFLWPIYMSLFLIPMEPSQKRRRILYGLMILGIIVASYLFFWVLKLGGVPVEVCYKHINYIFIYPLKSVVKYIYCICIVAPFFVSSLKRVWVLGVLFLLGFIYCCAGFISKENFISIWCFFATASSVVVYYILSMQEKSQAIE